MHTNSIRTTHFAALAADPCTGLGRLLGTGPRQPEPEGGEGEAGGAGEPESPPTVSRKAFDRLLGEKKTQGQKLRDLEARLAEFDAEKESRADDEARKAADWGKLEAKLKRQLEEQTKRGDDLEAKIATGDRDKRRRSFATEIAKSGSIANVDAVARFLPSLGLDDDAPEDLGSADVNAAIKALKRDVPELFGNGTTTLKPPPGGDNRPPDKNTGDYWREHMKKRSRGGLHSAYLSTTGRGKQE